MLTRRQRIIALRKRGLSRRQIAARLCISLSLVGSYLHQLLRKGVIKPSGRHREQTAAKNVNVQAAQKMRLAGKSYRDIGRHFGVAGSTVSRVIGSTNRVTPIQRQLIRLHQRGLTYTEIAAEVRKPKGTVAVILSRLVQKGLLPGRKDKKQEPEKLSDQ